MLKFQAVAEKTAKNFRGLLLPHPVDSFSVQRYLHYFLRIDFQTFSQISSRDALGLLHNLFLFL